MSHCLKSHKNKIYEKNTIEISILKQMQDLYKTDTISVKKPQEKMVPKEKAATASP